MIKLRLVLWCLLLSATLASCTYEEVAIHDIKGFKINKMEDRQIFFQFEIKLDNPNNYALKIKNSDLSINLNNKNLGQLYLSETLSVPAKNKDYVLVKSSVKTQGSAQDILSIMLGSLFTGALDVHIKGEVSGGSMIFPKKVQIDHAEKVRFDNQ
jgi:LEA14-like dessication related protein